MAKSFKPLTMLFLTFNISPSNSTAKHAQWQYNRLSRNLSCRLDNCVTMGATTFS
jgi:hypothetical protein